MTIQTGKIAIVTGASTGIGATIAERLAKDGYTVVVNYAGNTTAAEAGDDHAMRGGIQG